MLLDRTYDRQQLLDAVRQAWVLADRADVRDGLVPTILRNLQRDLVGKAAIESGYFAQQLTTAADRL